jgi:hypothetical protein
VGRKNVSLPDDLEASVRELLPDINVSAVLQDALRKLLEGGECPHNRLTCAECGVDVARSQVGGELAGRFYRELLHELGPLVDQLGTAEGAARIAKRIALELGVPGADHLGLPRPPRSAREARR